MAIKDKEEKKTTDLSQEAQKSIREANEQGRASFGFDVQQGKGESVLARGYDGSAKKSADQQNNNSQKASENQRRAEAPSNRPGAFDDEDGDSFRRSGLDSKLDSDSPRGEDDFDGDFSYGSSGHDGGESSYDGRPGGTKYADDDGYVYNGLYEDSLDGGKGSMSRGGRNQLEDAKAAKEQEEKEKKEEEEKKKDGEDKLEGEEGGSGEGSSGGKKGDQPEQSSEQMESARAQAADAGVSQTDIDRAQRSSEELNKKNNEGDSDSDQNLKDQLDKEESKEPEQRRDDKEGSGSRSSGEDRDKEKEKDKEKSEEEKAKDEGAAVLGAGAAANPNAMTGNGYDQNALGNGYKNPTQQSKMDDINRRNLQHNQQVNNSRNEDGLRNSQRNLTNPEDEKEKKAPGKGKGELKKDAPEEGDEKKKGKLKGKASNLINKAHKAQDFVDNPFRTTTTGLKNWLKRLLASHPMVLIAIIFGVFFIFALLLVVLGGVEGGTSSTFSGSGCNYTDLKGITTSGTVDLSGIQVELINCDGKENNYKVLEHIDFEKYVVGVALAEVSWDRSNPEYFKAQIVAARGFALRRNSAMCPSHPDNCFYGYNASTKTIRLRACTNDQVYCDYDKECLRIPRSGKPTLYGPEAEQEGSTTVWKGKLSETTKAEILAAAEEVKGKVLVDSSGNVVYTNFINTDQEQWAAMGKQGMKYDEILAKHYSSSGASGMSSADCNSNNVGNFDYGNYTLSSEGDTILNQRLDSFLQSKGTSLESFNQLISDSVNKAGYGTRAGVVAAAVTLIGELSSKYNVKVPYYYSGGHHDGVKVGAVGYWGGSTEDDGQACKYSAYGNVYDRCGLDCSGFVPWAVKNGGFNMGQNVAHKFQYTPGAEKVSLNGSSAVLQPGDLLESEQHVILVVGIDDGKKQYICAEASGKNEGVLFTRRSFSESGYWGVKMDGYYSNQSNVRR